MEPLVPLLVGLALVTAVLIAMVLTGPSGTGPRLTQARGGKTVVFLAYCGFPVLLTLGATQAHLHKARSTQFCLSCHEMRAHGRSLLYDDQEYLPAVHFQNRLIPRDSACFTCHTEYTMFGDLRSKMRGLRHVYVHYLGTPPKPGDLHLYTPFKNRECLHCHNDSRRYTEVKEHEKNRDDLKSNKLSCLECHDMVHDAGDGEDIELWRETLEKELP